MKIGILTFHNSNNYGAILQTYALQKKLKSLGYKPEIINYICKNKIHMYKNIDINLSKSIKYNIFQIINSPYNVVKNRKIRKFTKDRYIITDRAFFSSSEITREVSNWDFVICGSDQIWNHDNTGFDTTYLLDFIKDKEKKISYAASFGLDEIDPKYKKKYKELLRDINHLSVREMRGQEIIKTVVERESEVVLDPTLLISKSEWIQEIKYKSKYIKEKYILLYSLNSSSQIIELTKKISEKTGLKVIRICNTSLDFFNTFKPIIASVDEFIELINNAEYVVTDSFHGVAFSINLNKKFYVYLKDGLKSHSRILNLLKICNLENRSVKVINDIKLDNEIDYNLVNKLLEVERKKSINFIEKSIE